VKEWALERLSVQEAAEETKTHWPRINANERELKTTGLSAHFYRTPAFTGGQESSALH
jgi:hypothetical protein